MDVFVYREPTGFETFDLEDINELEEQLRGLEAPNPLTDKQEVKVEISGPWGEIRELLSHSCFQTIWFDPKRSPNAVGYHCSVCDIIEWAPSDRLPKGWIVSEPDERNVRLPLCPKCQQ